MRSFLLFVLLLPSIAVAKNCVIELKGDDSMKFDKQTITVSSSCARIDIKLTHTGKLPVTAMGHNVVITAANSFETVAKLGMSAGAAANYVPAKDARVIASTKLIGGGESTAASFPGGALKAGGQYTFFCSFPGHWAIMKGALVVE